MSARRLFRNVDRRKLLEVNKQECDNLVVRWKSPDLVEHLMKYMAKVKATPKL